MLAKSEMRRLRAEAHHLKPEFQVGKEGLTEPLKVQILEGFNTKELLKVKALETCPDDRATLAAKLAELPEVFMIQNIGHTYILFKKMDEQKKAALKAR